MFRSTSRSKDIASNERDHGIMKRVVVTGIGVVTPIGIGKERLWKGVLAGRSAVRRMDQFHSFRSQVGATVLSFEPTDFMDRKEARRFDRFSAFALAASR